MEEFKVRNPGSLIMKRDPNKKSHYWLYQDQLSDDQNWYTHFWFRRLINDKYHLSLKDYYNIIVYGDINYKHKCKNPKCNNYIEFSGNLSEGYALDACSKKCQGEVHSLVLQEIHRTTDTYKRTSHFIIYNSLESTKELRRQQAYNHMADKSSRGYGSEWHHRDMECQNILSRYDGSITRYIYLVNSSVHGLKLGSTRTLFRRFNALGVTNDDQVYFLAKGVTSEIAPLERDLLREFIDYTLRLGGSFSEYLDPACKDEVYKRLEEICNGSTTIERILDYKSEFLVE